MADFACRLIFVSAATASAAAHAQALSAHAEYQLGGDLFAGRVNLQGRISSHLVDLPAEVVRCANCHAVARGPDVPRSLAPRLTRELLLGKRSRRAGPESAYDRDSFCVLLQKGVDPAYVVVNVEMPRYQMNAGTCQALWRFLTWDPHEPATR